MAVTDEPCEGADKQRPSPVASNLPKIEMSDMYAVYTHFILVHQSCFTLVTPNLDH